MNKHTAAATLVSLLFSSSAAFADPRLEYESHEFAAHVQHALSLPIGKAPKVSTFTRWTPDGENPVSSMKRDRKPVPVRGMKFELEPDVLGVVRVSFPSEVDAMDWAGSNELLTNGHPSAVEVRGQEAVLVQRPKGSKIDEVKAMAAAWSYRKSDSKTLLMGTASSTDKMSARVFAPQGELYRSTLTALTKAREQQSKKPEQRTPSILYTWKGKNRVKVDMVSAKLTAIIRADDEGAFFVLKPYDPKKQTKSPEYARLKALMKARQAEQKQAKAKKVVAKGKKTLQKKSGEALEGAAEALGKLGF